MEQEGGDLKLKNIQELEDLWVRAKKSKICPIIEFTNAQGGASQKSRWDF